jgi:hypothetical protein
MKKNSRNGVGLVNNKSKSRITSTVLLCLGFLLIELIISASVVAQGNLVVNGSFTNGLANWTPGVLSSGSYSGYPKWGTEVYPSVGRPSAYLDVPGGAFAYLDSDPFYLPATGTLSLVMWGHHDPVVLGVQVVVQGGQTYVLDSFDPPKADLGQNPVTKQYPLLSNVVGQNIAVRLLCRSESQYATGTFCDYTDVDVTVSQQTCNDGQSWNGAQCVCPSGQQWNGQQCVTPPQS